METEIKEGDVFHAYWKDRSKDNHCFEGQLIAKSDYGAIVLYDTYWSEFGGNGGMSFKLAGIEKSLQLTYIANVNDFDITNPVENPYKYYLQQDVLYMHRQHACTGSCKYFYLRKGAQKSKVIQLHTLDIKLQEASRKIASLQSDIEFINKDIIRVHKGETVYI